MASDREPSHSKRPHVRTERMQEFIKAQEESVSPHKRLKCPKDWCNKVFTSAPGLKYHIQTHCTIEPQFICQRCHKVFKSNNGLKYHKEKTKCEETESSSMEHSRTQSTDKDQRVQIKPVPPPLTLPDPAGGMDKLTELAIIATGPQSPLMQKPHPPPWDPKPGGGPIRSLNAELELCDSGMVHYLDQEVTVERNSETKRSETNGTPALFDGSDPKVSTSSPLPLSPREDDLSSTTWSHSWPTAVWQCFIPGTKIKFLSGSSRADWEGVEHIAQREQLAVKASIKGTPEIQSYAPNGLCIRNIEALTAAGQSELEIKFSPDMPGQFNLLARCQSDHPFFVKNKGWSSVCPQETVQHYGIPCSELCVNDLCLPPSHPDAAFSKEVFKSFEEFDFTPEDTSAVFALSSMKQRKDSEISPKAGSVPRKRSAKSESPLKSKRPMNAFFLFAQEFRLWYTQKFPNRDNSDKYRSVIEMNTYGCLSVSTCFEINRAISAILGEMWKSLSAEKRQVYKDRAKVLADQQKKLNPDCWKRKK